MNKYHRYSFLRFLFIVVLFNVKVFGMDSNTKTALIIIDVQNFYFPGGKNELVNPEQASLNARKVLQKFRDAGLLVIHVRHNFEPGGEIHENVQPVNGEKVISKDHVNSFHDTDLLDYLKKNDIKKLVICGMMTHMCVEAATRAGRDFGFECVLIQDGCATKALKFKGKEISAEDVHYSTLSTLSGSYAIVVDAKTFLESF